MGMESLPVSVVGYGNLTRDDGASRVRDVVEFTDPRLKLRQVDMRVPNVLDAPALITLQGTRGFICHGDSGGAVFSDDFGIGNSLLFGINSKLGYGQGCTTTSFVARTDSNYDWIRDAMVAFGSRAPVPERASNDDSCAKVKRAAHGDATPPFVEITAANTCGVPIECSVIGWTTLSSGQMSPFKETASIAVGDAHTIKVFTHRPDQGYATAFCEKP